jgi:hypothetical protein
VNYSPSAHFNQLALPDDGAHRGDQARTSYTPGHGHPQASGHGQLRPLTAPYHSSQRAQPANHSSPSTSNRSGYVPDSYSSYNPEPSRGEEAGRGAYPHDLAPGTAQYSFPPPLPPPHQGYTPGSTSRVVPAGYPYARSMVQTYSGSGAIVPSGLVAPDQPSATSAKYECTYCGKGFTRPSSLKVRLVQSVHLSQKSHIKKKILLLLLF